MVGKPSSFLSIQHLAESYDEFLCLVHAQTEWIVLFPATPVNTFSSNSNLLRTSLIDSSNSIPIIRPRPRISLIPGSLCNSSNR